MKHQEGGSWVWYQYHLCSGEEFMMADNKKGREDKRQRTDRYTERYTGDTQRETGN